MYKLDIYLLKSGFTSLTNKPGLKKKKQHDSQQMLLVLSCRYATLPYVL